MGKRILDPVLMQKVAKKRGKSVQRIAETVSKKAGKLGIASEAALILLAKEDGIGTAHFQRKLDPAIQSQVRDALPSIFVPVSRAPGNGAAKKSGGSSRRKAPISGKAAVSLAIEYLIQDQMLLGRCSDLLKAKSNFDRPINQATQILEDRIRGKAQLGKGPTGDAVVNLAFKEDTDKTVLRVESADPDDQRGFTQILRGIVAAFRNKTHHQLTDTFSRQEAMRVVGFIDVLLRVVDNSVKVK
ncbi:MAG: TIGR02391 family protein [Stellaceae bacterium]